MEPLISVIVPVYKVENYLRECVDSICNQSYKNLEIILVDDGSPDSCPTICDDYAKKDSRVRVIHKVNGGLSDARNAGMEICQGEYLSFVDSDDVLPVDALKHLLELSLKEDADIVIGNNARFEEDLPELSEKFASVQVMGREEAMKDAFQNGCAAWARLYRREIHQGLLFPVGEINEDEAIVLQLLERCKVIAKSNAVVYFYRCRNESITTTSFSEKKMDWVKHCRDNLIFVRQKYPQLEEYAVQRYRGSLLWALREMALSERDFPEAHQNARNQLRQNIKNFIVTPFRNTNEMFRFVLFGIAPFPAVRAILKCRHRR